jgi:hypothetical protein
MFPPLIYYSKIRTVMIHEVCIDGWKTRQIKTQWNWKKQCNPVDTMHGRNTFLWQQPNDNKGMHVGKKILTRDETSMIYACDEAR